MSHLRWGGLAGAAITAGVFAVAVRASPRDFLDPVVWFVFGVLAGVGAFLGVSAVRAVRQVRESPRWLLATLVGLLLLSQPLVASFVRERRETGRFLATATATSGIVTRKFVRGGVHLVVEYRVGGRLYRVVRRGQNPLVGT